MIIIEKTKNHIKRGVPPPELIMAAHCAAFFGAILSFSGMWTDVPVAAGAALLALVPLLCRERKKTVRVELVLLGIFLIASIVFWRSWLNGAKTLANEIFAQSAERQQYLYDLYEVTDGGRTLFVGLSAAVIATVAGWTVGSIPWAAGTLLPLVIAGAGAYFGLVPEWIWLLMLVMTTGSLLLFRVNLRNLGILLLLGGLLFWMLMFLLPKENTALSAKEEQWRDQMANTTVANEQSTTSSSSTDPEPEPEDVEEAPVMLRLEKNLDMKTLLIILVILLILLMLFVPAVFKDRVQKKRERQREGMFDEDRAVAIQAVFHYAILWIRASGIEVPRESFSKLKSHLREDISENCAEEYEKILPIWEEAVFSDHPMAEEQWNRVMEFEQLTETTLMERASRWQQWKYKYRYAL